MKKGIIASILIVFMGFFGFLFLSLGNDPSVLPTELKGKLLPSFSGEKLDEEGAIVTIITEEDIQGPALLNVWATWCETCEAEHAMLNALRKEGVNVYGVNYKDDPKAAYGWLQKLGNPYIFTLSDVKGIVGIELGVYGAPETFFLDRDRRVLYRHVGEITAENWENQLKHYYYSSEATND